jgi:hypothetical protein
MLAKRIPLIVLIVCVVLLVPGAASGSASPLQPEGLASSLADASYRLGSELALSQGTPASYEEHPDVAYI